MASQTVLVTGANRGIGLELTRGLRASGATVIATARRPETADALQHLGGDDLRIEELDVTSNASVAALSQRLAGSPIDILINNSGIGGSRNKDSMSDFDSYRECFEVNALGALRVTVALLDNLRSGSKRQIVNLSSQLGSMTLNTGGGFQPYRVSKAALNMISRTFASELSSEGFVCVTLHPGWVRTDMGGRHAPVLPEESATGILEVLDRLGPNDNGSFFDYQGERIPW